MFKQKTLGYMKPCLTDMSPLPLEDVYSTEANVPCGKLRCNNYNKHRCITCKPIELKVSLVEV